MIRNGRFSNRNLIGKFPATISRKFTRRASRIFYGRPFQRRSFQIKRSFLFPLAFLLEQKWNWNEREQKWNWNERLAEENLRRQISVNLYEKITYHYFIETKLIRNQRFSNIHYISNFPLFRNTPNRAENAESNRIAVNRTNRANRMKSSWLISNRAESRWNAFNRVK